MATAPTVPLVPVDEYLNTSYYPDVEFVDGLLVEKSIPTEIHRLLSVILLAWFRQYEKELHIKALADVRTQIIERARYRLPDVLVVSTPLGRKVGPVMTNVPNVVIEIESPDDTHSAILDRFADYAILGVEHVILMHPEKRVAWRHSAESLIKTEFRSLTLPGRCELPFDTNAIFEQLKREVEELEGELPG
jgi:Uma2 family endonuclease